MSSEPQAEFKALFLGPYRSGKTSILEKYLYGKPPRDHVPTIGTEVFPKRIISNDMVVAINFWDMPGQDRTPTLNAQLVRDSQVVILVFDLSDRESFESLKEWKQALNARLEGVPVFLMGNKLDLIPNQRVAGLNKEMRDFSNRNSARNPIVQQFMVSAKADDQNLSECLQIIIEHLLRENMPLETMQEGIPVGRPRNPPGSRKLCPCV